jgi:gamma-glutamyltranspeptidase/glutathione hydrolase
MMECLPQEILHNDSPEKYQLLAEILHHAFIEYRMNPRNPNTFHQVADRNKLLRQTAERLIAKIKTKERKLGASDAAKQGMGETTHLSVIDADGNAVGLTQSLNLVYGAKVAAEGLGFLYNNYIEAFQFGHPDHYYNLRPNGIPWPCAAPTIVFKDSKPWLVFGSPGSQRIFSSMAQFLSSVVDRQMSIDKAMMQPRLHSEQNGELSLEAGRFDPAITGFFEEKGYRIKLREPYSFYMGAIHSVLMRLTGKGFQGVADIRRDGTAKGI